MAEENKGKEVVLIEGKLRKIIKQEGEGDLPKKGQEISALYKGTLETGVEFDSNQNRDSPFTFKLGEGRVIKGWEQGFASMRKGEKATLICSPEYAYGESGSPPRIPPNATLNFDVELLDFKDMKKQKWELSQEEKLSEATTFKNNGNTHFKEGQFKEAVAAYKQGIDYADGEDEEALKVLAKTLKLNVAQAYLKTGSYSEAIENCTKVLAEEEGNLKALYRRGVAYRRAQNFAAAKTDFKSLLALDPENADTKKELAGVLNDEMELRKKEKKMFSGMLTKGGLYDDMVVKPPQPEKEDKIESQEEELENEDDSKMEAQGKVQPQVFEPEVKPKEPQVKPQVQVEAEKKE